MLLHLTSVVKKTALELLNSPSLSASLLQAYFYVQSFQCLKRDILGLVAIIDDRQRQWARDLRTCKSRLSQSTIDRLYGVQRRCRFVVYIYRVTVRLKSCSFHVEAGHSVGEQAKLVARQRKHPACAIRGGRCRPLRGSTVPQQT